jgi:hypothetical protein
MSSYSRFGVGADNVLSVHYAYCMRRVWLRGLTGGYVALRCVESRWNMFHGTKVSTCLPREEKEIVLTIE